MSLSPEVVAREMMIWAGTKASVVGNAIEIYDRIKNRYEMTVYQNRLGQVEDQYSLMASQMQSILDNLSRENLSEKASINEFNKLQQFQSQGLSPMLFEGLLLNSGHLEHLKRDPDFFGATFVDEITQRRAGERIHILVAHGERPRILELPPFAFQALLARQSLGIPAAEISIAGDVMAHLARTKRVDHLKGGTAYQQRSIGQSLKSSVLAAKKLFTISGSRDSEFPPEKRSAASALVDPHGKPLSANSSSLAVNLILIQPGTFTMGSSQEADEQPPHKVTISKPFYLGRYQVTQELFEAVTEKHYNHAGYEKSLPETCVSWFGAIEFCNLLSKKKNKKPYYRIDGDRVSRHPGDGYRLPTEAEWEYACRAGTATKYPFGDDESRLSEFCWFASDSRHPVGGKKSNDWGLFDMLGNVWEWCDDCYNSDAYRLAISNQPLPKAVGDSTKRVMRGGGWRSNTYSCRPADRHGTNPRLRHDDIGFRIARSQA